MSHQLFRLLFHKFLPFVFFPASGIDDEECAKCPFSYMEVTFALSQVNGTQMLDGKSKFTNENNERLEESDLAQDESL